MVLISTRNRYPAGWLRLTRNYRAIMARVMADEASRTYRDEALTLSTHSEEGASDFVQASNTARFSHTVWEA